MEGMSKRSGWWRQVVFVVVVWLVLARQAQGIRFVIDKKECWQHEVPFDGDQVRVSYVVIKSESAWSFDHTAVGLDLIVEGPAGHQVHTSRAKVEDKFDFIAARKGLYKFCFFNRNSMHETVDFDVHVGYHIVSSDEEHVKDEHIEPLMMQIERLEESLYSIQFEQHWLLAQTDRQEIGIRYLHLHFLHFLSTIFECCDGMVQFTMKSSRDSSIRLRIAVFSLDVFTLWIITFTFFVCKPGNHLTAEVFYCLGVGIMYDAVNQAMSKRFMYKAVLEALALVGCSVLQVVLLRRLFDRKLGQSSRV